jgi:hypothetical protein
MRTTVIRSFLTTLALASAACGGGSGSNAPAPVTLELDTWWNAGGKNPTEIKPIQAVIDLHTAAHPNVTVTVVSADSQAAMDANLQNAFTRGSPPAALQANLGANATQFAVSALGLTPAWTSNFSQSVLDTLTANGKLVGVPLGLTRQNTAYWNLQVLSTLPAGLNTIPVGLDAFKTWIKGVSDPAVGYTHPLCFGFKDAWVNAHILFEDIVPAFVGADYDKTYWSGKDTTQGAQISAALDFAHDYVWPYLTTDTPTLDMGGGIDRVMTPQTDKTQQCIMTAMGDWGGAQLSAKNQAGPGKDFDGAGWPGAENLVVFGGDAMVAAAGTGNEKDVRALFDTFASEAGQLKFASLKGEIPARSLTMADQQTLPYLIQVNMKAMAQGTVPGFKVIAKAAYDTNGISTAAQNLFLSGDKAPLLAFMTSNYANLM